jgi:mono/diheme cytochrome c family protein
MKLVIPSLLLLALQMGACDQGSAPSRAGSTSRSGADYRSDAESHNDEDDTVENSSQRADLQENSPQTTQNQGVKQPQKNQNGQAVSLTEIRPLIEKHCVRCHGASGSRSDLTKDSQIITRGAEIVRRTASKFNGMPSDNPKAVTDSEKELLQQWKLGGYQK